MFDYKRLLADYESGCFVDAYEQTRESWQHPGLVDEIGDPVALLLAGRLAFRLGGAKYGRWIFRVAARRFPGDPDVRYYTHDYCRRFRTSLEYLQYLESEPPQFDGRSDLQAFFLARAGHTWASVRDFDNAHRTFDQAFSLGVDDGWVTALWASALLCEDRVGEALEQARKAWDMRPGHPYSAESLNACLCRAEKQVEAARFTYDAAIRYQSIDIVLMACFNMLQVCRRLGPLEHGEWLAKVNSLVARFDWFAPLADQHIRVAMARVRLEAAMLEERFDEARRQVAAANHPYFQQVLSHEEEHPDSDRIRLDCRPVRQRWQTCLPSSIATVLSCFGVDLDPEEMAAAATYHGTAIWLAEEWLTGRGYQVRHFMFTPENAGRLIRDGIPFVMHETYTSSGHSVAVVGIDFRLGVLLVHDPSDAGLRSMILDRVADAETPFGPHCTLVLPPGRRMPGFREEDTVPVAGFYEYLQAREEQGVKACGAVLNDLSARFPGHAMTRFMHAEYLMDVGRTSQAMSMLSNLHEQHPDCRWVHRSLLLACNRLMNTAARRRTLAAIVNRRSLPGNEKDGACKWVPPEYLCDYADCLRETHDTLPDALRMMRQALRKAPTFAHAYHIVADVMLAQGRDRDMILPLRVACMLDREDDHYAWSYFDALRRAGRMEEGMAFLAERALRLGRHAKGAEAWNLYIDELEDAGRVEQALEQARRSLGLFPDDPRRLEFCARLFTRQGCWQEAEDCLDKLKEGDHFGHYAHAAAPCYFLRGMWSRALEIATEWVRQEPGNINARGEMLRLQEHAHGLQAALDLAREWHQENPEIDDFAHMVLELLDRKGRGDERLRLLDERVRDNPHDAWAWRAIGFYLLSEVLYDSGDKRGQYLDRGRQALEQCRRLCPGWSVAVMESQLAELAGDYETAIRLLFVALDDQPDYFSAYRRIVQLSGNLPSDEQRIIFRRMEDCCKRVAVGHDWSFVHRAAQNFGASAACRLIDRLQSKFPENPDLHETRADILLRYGRGADREAMPEAEFASIIEFLRPLVSSYPAHRGLRLSLADALIRSGDETGAIEVLRDFVRLAPMDMTARRMLAVSLENCGMREQALAILRESLEFAPADSGSYNELANFFERAGARQEQAEIIRKGLAKLPDSIWLIERAIEHYQRMGDLRAAVEVARHGTEYYPDGAYLWCLYGKALANLGEDFPAAESALQKALDLNRRLFDAADRLAYLLVMRGRFESALQVMEPFLAIPDHAVIARGRMAWCMRQKGDREQAYDWMQAALANDPGYAWGWEIIMEWIRDDGDKQRARKMLREIPESMQYNDDFRSDRIQLLQELLTGEFRLDREWELILRDFPDSVPLYLQRFDNLWEAGKREQAAGVLEHIRARFPGNRFVIARQVAVLADTAGLEQAVELAVGLWTSPAMENDWPDHYAWKVLADAGVEPRCAFSVGRVLADGGYLRPAAVSCLMGFVCKAGRKPVRHLAKLMGISWFKRGRDKIIDSILTRLLREPYAPDALAAAMGACTKGNMAGEVVRFYKMHSDECSRHGDVLGEVVSALLAGDPPRWARVRQVLADWRRVKGMRMWLVTNYLIALEQGAPEDHAGIVDNCLDLLRNFQHDRNAWFVTGMLLEHSLLAGDYDAVREYYREFEVYADRGHTEDEFVASSKQWYDCAFPMFMELLDAGAGDIERLLKTLMSKAADDYRTACEPIARKILQSRGLKYRRPGTSRLGMLLERLAAVDGDVGWIVAISAIVVLAFLLLWILKG